MSKIAKYLILGTVLVVVMVLFAANRIGQSVSNDFEVYSQSEAVTASDVDFKPIISSLDAEELKKTEMLAKQGNAKAQYELGKFYSDKWSVPGNRAKAARWFQKAAEQGNAKAEYGLGRSYENGWGVSKNIDEAVIWITKSAKQGHADAQYKLGKYYMLGKGVPYDKREGKNWWLKSANQGNVDAQFELGVYYESGFNADEDIVLAYHYYSLAAAQGHKTAQGYRSDVFNQLTPSQIAEVEKPSEK